MALGQRRLKRSTQSEVKNSGVSTVAMTVTAEKSTVTRMLPYGGRYNYIYNYNNSSNSKSRTFSMPILLIAVFALVIGIQMIQQSDISSSTSYVPSADEIYNRFLGTNSIQENKDKVNGDDDDDDDNNDDIECTIPRFHIDEKLAKGLGTNVGPVLLEGWDFDPKVWNKKELMDRVGEYPQYLKDLTVQPFKRPNNKNKNKNKGNDLCTLKGKDLADLLPDHDLLFFTNNKENAPFMKDVRTNYETPSIVNHINGFEVFSALDTSKYHSFHKHGESWLGQVSGRRVWWFLPPDTTPVPERVDSCGYLTRKHKPPPNTKTCIQNPGEIIWFPKDWYHATCALDEWTVGIGAQQGRTIRQNFPKLKPRQFDKLEKNGEYPQRKKETIEECLPTKTSQKGEKENDEWQWFDGDLNAYYNSLETQIHDRNPKDIASYAVHRWMGKKRSTEEHYELIDRAVLTHHVQKSSLSPLRVFDGGCGLGSALMFFERRHPDWKLTGNTISEEQHKFIETKLPQHKFKANLQSYDDIDDVDENGDKILYDVIYSIEALIHSTDVAKTMKEWAQHLAPGGIIVIIDDYVSEGVDKTADDIQNFSKSWLANVLITPMEFENLANTYGLKLVENRDLLEEYEIVKINYKNNKPTIKPVDDRNHQGWMGSKWRQRLTVEGKLKYNMIVLKNDNAAGEDAADDTHCEAVPYSKEGPNAEFTEITPQLMSGKGSGGGKAITCISGWYCCNKGFEWWDRLDAHRTDNTAFLKLDRNLFGHYVDIFTKRLNEYYANYPASFGGGRFLDIGGTGSTASGMQKVTSKFQHFAGPLDYWKLDSDPAAKEMERTLFCDIDDCPEADNCGFDVTFSHTVLEHAKRPWKSFDTIARITKKGGLTLHLVPWSYQYHATPDDNYRFSHKALITLLEDRGFDVLDVGYDICTKQDHKMKRIGTYTRAICEDNMIVLVGNVDCSANSVAY